VIAIAAAVFFLVTTDSRILPALLFNSKFKSKESRTGLIGVHEWSVAQLSGDPIMGVTISVFAIRPVAGVSNHKQLLMLFTTNRPGRDDPQRSVPLGGHEGIFLKKLGRTHQDVRRSEKWILRSKDLPISNI
jgi:hypothetical protein